MRRSDIDSGLFLTGLALIILAIAIVVYVFPVRAQTPPCGTHDWNPCPAVAGVSTTATADASGGDVTVGGVASNSQIQLDQGSATAMAPFATMCVQGVSGQALLAGGSINNLHPLCSLILYADTVNHCSVIAEPHRDWCLKWAMRIVRSDVNALSVVLGYVPLGDKIR